MPSLSKSDVLQFREQGFLIIRNVYNPTDLLAARSLFQHAFSSAQFHDRRFDSDTLLTDIYSHFPELAGIIFNEKYWAVAKELLGEQATLIPECAIHRERYIDWHKDTTVQEMAGLSSHAGREADPILQFATYFQDNTENGGGLTVIPGSQHWPDPFLKWYGEGMWQRIWNKVLKIMGLSVFHRLEKQPGKTDLPIKTGDLLVFDVRIFHRATFRKQGMGPEKFAIFNTFIRQTKAGLDYFHFMKKRPEPYYAYFREKPLPPALVNHYKELNINILY